MLSCACQHRLPFYGRHIDFRDSDIWDCLFKQFQFPALAGAFFASLLCKEEDIWSSFRLLSRCGCWLYGFCRIVVDHGTIALSILDFCEHIVPAFFEELVQLSLEAFESGLIRPIV